MQKPGVSAKLVYIWQVASEPSTSRQHVVLGRFLHFDIGSLALSSPTGFATSLKHLRQTNHLFRIFFLAVPYSFLELSTHSPRRLAMGRMDWCSWEWPRCGRMICKCHLTVQNPQCFPKWRGVGPDKLVENGGKQSVSFLLQ